MKKLLIISLLASSSCYAQKKIWWQVAAGAQTLTPMKLHETFSHSVYVIAIAGKGKFSWNVQFIQPLPYNTLLFKIGADITIFKSK